MGTYCCKLAGSSQTHSGISNGVAAMNEIHTQAEQATHIGEMTVATLKAVPPAVVTGMHLLGHPVADWLACTMLLYTLVQLLLLLEKRFLTQKDK